METVFSGQPGGYATQKLHVRIGNKHSTVSHTNETVSGYMKRNQFMVTIFRLICGINRNYANISFNTTSSTIVAISCFIGSCFLTSIIPSINAKAAITLTIYIFNTF